MLEQINSAVSQDPQDPQESQYTRDEDLLFCREMTVQDWEKRLGNHKITPMLRQYIQLKTANPGTILFFRLGDFYEMFFEDAEIAARELDIVLTSRNKESDFSVPMAGVPHHSARQYIARLVKKGYRVSICEQVEDPSQAKGLVRREIVRIVTPGTLVEADMLDEDFSNYLTVLAKDGDFIGMGAIDVSTGQFITTQANMNNIQAIKDEIIRLDTSECLIEPELFGEFAFLGDINARPWSKKGIVEGEPDQALMEKLGTITLEPFGIVGKPACIKAANMALDYVESVYGKLPGHIEGPKYYQHHQYMIIDSATRHNLELITSASGDNKHSLAGILDMTKNAMGRRTLREWIGRPLLNLDDIKKRQECVAELFSSMFLRQDLEFLMKVPDLQRLAGATASGNANPRDIYAISVALEKIPEIKETIRFPHLSSLIKNFPDCEEIFTLIRDTLIDSPPATLKDKSVIRAGVSRELDELKDAATGGKRWLADLEAQEREKTGIKSLKVSYNKVFGYYIEVSSANLHLVPEHYIRKQTLSNAERYYTAELKEKESLILGAKDRCANLEAELFCELREKIAEKSHILLQASEIFGQLDALLSMANISVQKGYIRPTVDDKDRIYIHQGRHPVVESVIGIHAFVPNSCELDQEQARLAIITGPNMAGKSTYIRQVALITLMAQMGCFVPAVEARIGVVDRIFTRVGASDNLSRGQSTFMVEMVETATILSHATKKSLIILDEIGRGTSTFDGLSIAWAVAEYIYSESEIGAKCLFATHYHELVELADILPKVVNYSIAVSEKDGEVVFLHKIIAGGADRSYGIEVAKLAGLPNQVVNRANQILRDLQASNVPNPTLGIPQKTSRKKGINTGQLNLFSLAKPQEIIKNAPLPPLIERIKKINPDELTPREALDLIYKLHQELL